MAAAFQQHEHRLPLAGNGTAQDENNSPQNTNSDKSNATEGSPDHNPSGGAALPSNSEQRGKRKRGDSKHETAAAKVDEAGMVGAKRRRSVRGAAERQKQQRDRGQAAQTAKRDSKSAFPLLR